MFQSQIEPFPAFLSAGGEMGARIRATDWSHTPLGPVDAWPQSLRLALGICLNSRFPMFVWWGPELINFYNDAYIPVLGTRHPAQGGCCPLATANSRCSTASSGPAGGGPSCGKSASRCRTGRAARRPTP